MNYDRYSKAAFEVCGLNSEAARKLSDQLQEDVNADIHAAVLAAFERVVANLNARGHKLHPYGELRPGDVDFRDQTNDDDCKLRLGYYVTMCAGYAHTVTPEEAEEQFLKDTADDQA